MFKNSKILYVEDEDFIRENLHETLEIMRIDATGISNPESAFQMYKELKPNVVLLENVQKFNSFWNKLTITKNCSKSKSLRKRLFKILCPFLSGSYFDRLVI